VFCSLSWMMVVSPLAEATSPEHEVRYEAKKIGASKSEVKRAVKSVGVSRKKVEDRLSSR
jgi:hypothetical protein